MKKRKHKKNDLPYPGDVPKPSLPSVLYLKLEERWEFCGQDVYGREVWAEHYPLPRKAWLDLSQQEANRYRHKYLRWVFTADKYTAAAWAKTSKVYKMKGSPPVPVDVTMKLVKNNETV